VPPKDFDAETYLNFVVETIKIVNLYGPVFQKMTVRHAVQFLAKKIGDPSPPTVETMEDCAKYVRRNLEKYPNGFCAFAYGVGKAQNTLEGNISSGGRSILKDGMKAFLEKMGTASMYGSGSSTTEVLKTLIAAQTGMRILPGEAVLTGDESSSVLSYKGCRFGDSCVAMHQEGIRRSNGEVECSNARSHQAVVEHTTKAPHDFQVVKYDPPNCSFKIFKV
jgi:hypothetical protein